MTKDDIIRMAQEAWVLPDAHIPNVLEFANLVAAAEREACAKVCDELVTHAQTKGDNDAMFAAISCATAIRIRGNNGQT
jgi:hypothetical protein